MHIDSYEFGRMVVDGREERRDVILAPPRLHPNWWRDEGHSLSLGDLDVLLDDPPRTLVVGTGASGNMRPDAGLADALAERGIQLEAMTTDRAACRFNELAADGESHVAGAFHLTC